MVSALERIGYRWSLRQPPLKGMMKAPCDYVDPAEALPEGFLDKMAGVRRVIGWASQIPVLAHSTIGGFVSRCGWNSTLESIWFDVPVAAWPQYTEQQFNKFRLVVELGLAAEIKMDYRRDHAIGIDGVATADEIEGGIKKLMEGEEARERRKKVKEVSEKGKEGFGGGWLFLLAFGSLHRGCLESMSLRFSEDIG